jgi:hypothetical protein
MHEYGATDLQMEQVWIQMKEVHPLYQLQLVLSNNNIIIYLTKPRK